MSQMSGTTAITSYSAGELQDLVTMKVVGFLPDLLGSSYRILDQLAPAGADFSKVKTVESIMRDLKVLGSWRATRLKHDEESFEKVRQWYGSDKYIQIPLILRKLFGTSEADFGSFRPDAILQAANLSTLVVVLMVTQKESPSSVNDFGAVDKHFPQQFLSEFNSTAEFGNSKLASKSFTIGLDLRTQFSIVALIHHQRDVDFDPDRILATCFFDSPPQPDANTTYFDDFFHNGQLKEILQGTPNSNSQKGRIKARVKEIRQAFRDNPDAADAGDLVDFEFLEDEFPWNEFISDVVRWTRSRLDEITESIKKQGSVETIMKSLIETVKDDDGQADLQYEPLPAILATRRLLPPANIIASTPGTRYVIRARRDLLFHYYLACGVSFS
jgi:hypothetical protein